MLTTRHYSTYHHVCWALPGWTFGSWYCQKKHPVITRDRTRKKTKPSWVHFTFILPTFVSPSNLTVAAGAATAGVGLKDTQTCGNTQQVSSELLAQTPRELSHVYSIWADIFSSMSSAEHSWKRRYQKSLSPCSYTVQVIPVALNRTHHLMLHRPERDGLPVTQKSSYHSINIRDGTFALSYYSVNDSCNPKAVNGVQWRFS